MSFGQPDAHVGTPLREMVLYPTEIAPDIPVGAVREPPLRTRPEIQHNSLKLTTLPSEERGLCASVRTAPR